MKLVTVVGNRPQFIKAAAVSRHLRGLVPETLIHTGQHYDRELSEVFFEELGLPEPDYRLEVGSGTHAAQTAAAMAGLAGVVADERPDGVLVYGDTNTTLAAALVAAKLPVPLAHIEAGMRSFDRSMPEEINRVCADHLAELLLCSTGTAVANLAAEGIAEGVRLVGDVMADVAFEIGPIAERRSEVLAELGLEPGGYFVATAHRAANVDNGANLERLVELLMRLAADHGPLVLPLHPRTRDRLLESGHFERLDSAPGVEVLPPIGYLDFACLVRRARAVATDSGGLQKEAYLAGVPCLTLREETEWVETVESGWNRLVGLDPERASSALAGMLERRAAGESPDPTIYGDGKAGHRCAEALAAWLDR